MFLKRPVGIIVIADDVEGLERTLDSIQRINAKDRVIVYVMHSYGIELERELKARYTKKKHLVFRFRRIKFEQYFYKDFLRKSKTVRHFIARKKAARMPFLYRKVMPYRITERRKYFVGYSQAIRRIRTDLVIMLPSGAELLPERWSDWRNLFRENRDLYTLVGRIGYQGRYEELFGNDGLESYQMFESGNGMGEYLKFVSKAQQLIIWKNRKIKNVKTRRLWMNLAAPGDRFDLCVMERQSNAKSCLFYEPVAIKKMTPAEETVYDTIEKCVTKINYIKSEIWDYGHVFLEKDFDCDIRMIYNAFVEVFFEYRGTIQKLQHFYEEQGNHRLAKQYQHLWMSMEVRE